MAKGFKLDAADLDGGLERVLSDFCRLEEDGIREAVEKGARVCRDTLRETEVPGDTGEYSAGWRYKTEPGSYTGSEATVYNTSKPSLTHLLEKGHELWVHGKDTGRRAPAYLHIAPAADAGMEAMEKELGR